MDFSEYNEMPSAKSNLTTMMKEYDDWLNFDDEEDEDEGEDDCNIDMHIIDDATINSLLTEASYEMSNGSSSRAFQILIGISYLASIPKSFYEEVTVLAICGYRQLAGRKIEICAQKF